MNVIACLDDAGGMMFNRRRQSRDRLLLADLKAMTVGTRLWVSPYSEKLLTEQEISVCVADDFLTRAGKDDWCFVEDRGAASVADRICCLVIYRWNRLYPGDLFWDIKPEENGFRLVEQTEFAGYSHENITKEIWKR